MKKLPKHINFVYKNVLLYKSQGLIIMKRFLDTNRKFWETIKIWNKEKQEYE